MTFPDDEDFPALAAEFAKIALVTFFVALSFVLPESDISRRFYFSVAAVVHVPEKAVNENEVCMKYSLRRHIR